MASFAITVFLHTPQVLDVVLEVDAESPANTFYSPSPGPSSLPFSEILTTECIIFLSAFAVFLLDVWNHQTNKG